MFQAQGHPVAQNPRPLSQLQRNTLPVGNRAISFRVSRHGVSLRVSVNTPMLESFTRLIELLEEPDAIPVVWPLIQREIHYRLLLSDQAPLLRNIASVGSKGHRIAKAIDWMKLNYSAPLRVDELASQVQMGPSTFHQHFRQLTAMSPLQYQKWLRLNEAKRLMLNENLDAATAAFKVGYESPSQFSREYGRPFGTPPKTDIAALRRGTSNA
ncbi:Regulatory protein PchR [compost metagenome]